MTDSKIDYRCLLCGIYFLEMLVIDINKRRDRRSRECRLAHTLKSTPLYFLWTLRRSIRCDKAITIGIILSYFSFI